MISSNRGYFGCQPSSSRIFAELATRRGASPGRRGLSTAEMGCPVTLRAGLNDLAHGIPCSISQVVKQRVLLFQTIQRQQVGADQVCDVDVVTDVGAIRGGIVAAEDLDVLASAPMQL